MTLTSRLAVVAVDEDSLVSDTIHVWKIYKFDGKDFTNEIRQINGNIFWILLS